MYSFIIRKSYKKANHNLKYNYIKNKTITNVDHTNIFLDFLAQCKTYNPPATYSNLSIQLPLSRFRTRGEGKPSTIFSFFKPLEGLSKIEHH